MTGAGIAMTQLVSLDGVAELADEWVAAAGEAVQAAFAESMAEEQAFLLGRRSYEEFSSYWPQQAERDDATGRMARHLAQVPKFVVSRTLTDPGWAGTTVLGGDPVEAVRRLQQRLGTGTIGVNGSLTLSRALLAAGLVDELRTYVVPVVAGRGGTLVSGTAGARPLQLVDSAVLDGGVVRLLHRR